MAVRNFARVDPSNFNKKNSRDWELRDPIRCFVTIHACRRRQTDDTMITIIAERYIAGMHAYQITM